MRTIYFKLVYLLYLLFHPRYALYMYSFNRARSTFSYRFQDKAARITIYGLKHRSLYLWILRAFLPRMNSFLIGGSNAFLYWDKKASVFEIYLFNYTHYIHI
jgi:hypothetical protein